MTKPGLVTKSLQHYIFLIENQSLQAYLTLLTTFFIKNKKSNYYGKNLLLVLFYYW